MTDRPAVQPPKDWQLGVPERAQLDNGLRVEVMRRPGQQVISAALVLEAPLAAEPATAEGVANLTQQAIFEGTQTHPEADFMEALENCGADLGGHSGHSATQLHLDVPVSRLGPALELLAEALCEPTLDATDLERLRQIRLAQIDAEMASPGYRAARGFQAAMIPERFRANRPGGGTPDTVAGVTAAQVRAWYERWYVPAGATLILAGDFAADPFGLAESAFARWNGGGRPCEPEAPIPAAPSCLLVDQPGAVQAEVRLGAFGLDRADPRFAELSVACYALGGAFLSRLNGVLREEKGFTYGVQLVNSPLRHGGLLAMQGSFRTEVAAAAIDTARTILDLSGKPLTGSEVADAVSFSRGVAPLAYATAGGLVGQLANLAAAGLRAEWVDDFGRALAVVTPEGATSLVAELLAPERLTLVVVGDADALAGPLEAAGWNPERRRPDPSQ